MMSIVISSFNKKRRILKMTNEINHSENNILAKFEFKSKQRIKNLKTCRKYITARKRGKLTKVGNKERVKYTFLPIYNVINVVYSSLKTSNQDSYAFGADTHVIDIDNHAS